MDLQTLENEVLAWRKRFPQHEYRAQDDCVALKFDHAYGCHCDLDPGMKPDKCVLDEGRSFDCTKAQQLLREGKGRNDCDEWKPIELHNAGAEPREASASGNLLSITRENT